MIGYEKAFDQRDSDREYTVVSRLVINNHRFVTSCPAPVSIATMIQDLGGCPNQ